MNRDYEYKRFNDEEERNKRTTENIERNKEASFVETVSKIIDGVIRVATLVKGIWDIIKWVF